jgi:hypothetical protein
MRMSRSQKIPVALQTSGNKPKRKDDRIMYEVPEVLAIGEAQDLILGVKPFFKDYVDWENAIDRADRVEDIDETED